MIQILLLFNFSLPCRETNSVAVVADKNDTRCAVCNAILNGETASKHIKSLPPLLGLFFCRGTWHLT